MRHAQPLLALIACGMLLGAAPAEAAPGDAFVPAHRTKDGHYVPANVPPLSGGTHLARRPGRSAVAHRPAKHRAVRIRSAVPMFVEARPVRR
jgi:hypothetical protein